MSAMIRAAVVGLGYWGPNLARNFSASVDYQLVGLCDTDQARLATMAAHYPSALVANDVDGVLASKPDLVAIAIPVAQHYDVARRCLDAGCHVLVEKPFTATTAEACRLLDVARTRGKHIFVDHTYLFTGAVQEMKRQVVSGGLGHMLYVDSVRINLGLFQPDVDVIWDLAPHDLSVFQYLLGRVPRTVSAVGSSHNPTGAADVAYLHLDYGDALTAHLHLSWLSPVKVRRMIVAGTRQSLIFDDLDQDAKVKLYDHGVGFDMSNLENRRQLLVSYRKGEMRAPAVSTSEALVVQLEEISGVLAGRGTSRATGDEGLGVVKVLEAASQSLRSGGNPVCVE
jgi:predicted dehydrogenase